MSQSPTCDGDDGGDDEDGGGGDGGDGGDGDDYGDGEDFHLLCDNSAKQRSIGAVHHLFRLWQHFDF